MTQLTNNITRLQCEVCTERDSLATVHELHRQLAERCHGKDDALVKAVATEELLQIQVNNRIDYPSHVF